MRTVVKGIAVGFLAVMTFFGIGAPAAQAAEAAHGCPSGYVCIYPNGSWNNDRPSLKFYTYGSHNLSNQYGTKRMFNNQYGTPVEADSYWCTGYNGGDMCGSVKQGEWEDMDFTPINSIILCCRQPTGPALTDRR